MHEKGIVEVMIVTVKTTSLIPIMATAKNMNNR
jgi:hypothetical protein